MWNAKALPELTNHPQNSNVFSVPRLPELRWKSAVLAALLLTALQVAAREKDATQYGMGLMENIPYPASEVAQVVREVVQNGVIRGTKEYNKDPYISGATSASSTPLFPRWTEGGQVFYKVRLKALDPRNFKDSSDVGTLAVRYVVQPQGDKNTVLRIDAVFAEDFRRATHPSNGSVESAEYKDIHDHLEAVELMKAETREAERVKQAKTRKPHSEALAAVPPPASSSSGGSTSQPSASATSLTASFSSSSGNPPPTTAQVPSQISAAAPSSEAVKGTDAHATSADQTLESQVHNLRRQVERLVKAPGAPLKSAPFHSASTLQSLPPGTEVLIVISTPYWVGIETHDGQHGWMLRDDLELLP